MNLSKSKYDSLVDTTEAEKEEERKRKLREKIKKNKEKTFFPDVDSMDKSRQDKEDALRY
jgi:hypothetical protein